MFMCLFLPERVESGVSNDLTFFHADFGKEFPSRTLWRGLSSNCPSPTSVVRPLLYRTEHFSRGKRGRKGAKKGGRRVVATKKGKKEERTRENRSVTGIVTTEVSPNSRLLKMVLSREERPARPRTEAFAEPSSLAQILWVDLLGDATSHALLERAHELGICWRKAQELGPLVHLLVLCKVLLDLRFKAKTSGNNPDLPTCTFLCPFCHRSKKKGTEQKQLGKRQKQARAWQSLSLSGAPKTVSAEISSGRNSIHS